MPSKKAQQTRRKKTRVAVITGTRAEFGLLVPVLRALKRSRRLESRLIVTGMHLLPRFGRTIDEIQAGNWRIDAVVRMQKGTGNPADETEGLASGIRRISRELGKLDCDIVIVLGDRIEAFAGASAAAFNRRILAHIHGGDRAMGDLDDLIRDAISRLANVHLVASKEAAERLADMGEPKSHIHRVGAPGLDDIRAFREHARKHPKAWRRDLTRLLAETANEPYALVSHHPIGRSDKQEADAMRAIVEAVEKAELTGVAIMPNSDPGHRGIVKVLNEVRNRENWRIFPSLSRQDYFRVALGSEVMVGNSSSAIIESATLGTPAVTVGDRQRGRLRCSSHVLDAKENTRSILQKIRQARDLPRPQLRNSVYGDGTAGEKIVKVLEKVADQPRYQRKVLAR